MADLESELFGPEGFEASTIEPEAPAAPGPEPIDANAPAGQEAEAAPGQTEQDDAPAQEGAAVSEGRLNALLAERDKRQAAEREAQELKRQLEQFQQRQAPAPAPQQPTEAPDPVMDPQGFQAWIVNEQYRQREQISQVAAVRHYGLDKVAAAEQAINAAGRLDPSLIAKVKSQPDPYGFAVEWHQQQQMLQQVQGYSSLDDLIAAEAVKRGYVRAGEGQPVTLPAKVVTQSTTQPPPRSLASAPTTPRGNPVDTTAADEFEGKLFGRK